ncbi:CLCA_X family protein [Glaciecola siphonariae]|uniref:CLCA_X family protein n=1 Tax=Glaciecola siphonariae TaxID=521012 RepID=A0ABV9LQH6_9ALTE
MTVFNKSRLYKAYFRNGENHRGGADVSFADIVKLFGFRGVEIGKWVSKEEQQIAANLFFDALSDLMDILQVPSEVISLRGTLALAFGAGGQKFASAHYNSSKRQLALAKNAGGGSLAHEWFHAFDHYISNKMYDVSGPNQFATELWLNELHPMHNHALNEQLASAFQSIFLDQERALPSEFVQSGIRADKMQNVYYYARPQELGARAFESVIQDHAIKNAFLVQGTKETEEAKLGLYPRGETLQRIGSEFYTYFALLGRALS